MTLTNFQSYVKQIFKRTDKDTEITQSYNDSVLAVANAMPHGAYKYQSYIATVDGQEDYSLPSTMVHIMHPIRYIEGSASTDSGWQLEQLSKEEYDEIEPNPNRTSPNKGDPNWYTVFSGQILVSPIPDNSTDYLEINWTKIPTDQSSGSDTIALPDYWREVLRQMTLKRMYEGIELYEEAQYWRAQYEDDMGNPVGQYAKLLDIEKSKEQFIITRIKVNAL